MTVRKERKVNALVVASVLAAIALGAFAFLAGMSLGGDDESAGEGGPDCAEWRCAALVGLTRSEVAALAGDGPIARDGNVWRLSAGTVNDALGPGDANYVTITFEDGEVRRAR